MQRRGGAAAAAARRAAGSPMVFLVLVGGGIVLCVGKAAGREAGSASVSRSDLVPLSSLLRTQARQEHKPPQGASSTPGLRGNARLLKRREVSSFNTASLSLLRTFAQPAAAIH